MSCWCIRLPSKREPGTTRFSPYRRKPTLSKKRIAQPPGGGDPSHPAERGVVGRAQEEAPRAGPPQEPMLPDHRPEPVLLGRERAVIDAADQVARGAAV